MSPRAKSMMPITWHARRCSEQLIPKPRHGPWSISTTSVAAACPTLIRDLLDRLPDTKVAPEEVDLPPLGHEPSVEGYTVLKPIPPYNS